MLQKYKWKIVAAAVILCALGFAFWYGGNAPGLRGWKVPTPAAVSGDTAAVKESVPTVLESDIPDASPAGGETSAAEIPENTGEPAVSEAPEESPGQSPSPSAPPSAAPGSDAGRPLTADEKQALAKSIAGGKSSEQVEQGDADYSRSRGMEINSETGKDRYDTDPVPEGKPVPVEPKDAAITDKELTCTLSVRCDTILDNMSWLDQEKVELVPEDGVIFPATAVTFYQGESVFNVLRREMKKAGIHMEFEDTPLYNSAYIEGINNLYEFDVGELSGWMYKVNGWFPNYGCSRYQLKDGDVVEWVYTCNLGIDVDGYYSVGG